MENTTIKKKELLRLKRQAKAFRKLAAQLFECVINDPVQEVVEDFKKTDLYSKDFLCDLENGLRRSSYCK